MKRYQFLGWIIERGITGWYVIDWDYETESVFAGPFRTERAAQDFAASR